MANDQTEEILTQGMAKIGIPTDRIPSLVSAMNKYIGELCLFNSAYNLVNTEDHTELAVRHILDSLAPFSILEKTAVERQAVSGSSFMMADIGSGGGLPGIPLAAAFPQYRFTLVERMSKRCAFLENCAAVLNLQNVQVENLEAEKVKHESIDVAVFRAFRPLDSTMIKTLLALLKKGGTLAAYKAKHENIVKEMEGIRSIIQKYDVQPLIVPFFTDTGTGEDRERNLVLIRK